VNPSHLEHLEILPYCVCYLGNLERLDLMENTWDNQLAHASLLSAIKRNGKPIVILPLRSASDAPYDDDP
jgi:hypothetical protein